MPFYNEAAGGYRSAYRCPDHWRSTVASTRANFKRHVGDRALRASFFAVFEARGIAVPADAEQAEAAGLALLDRITSGDLRLTL